MSTFLSKVNDLSIRIAQEFHALYNTNNLFIRNQSSVTQTSDFKISGTGTMGYLYTTGLTGTVSFGNARIPYLDYITGQFQTSNGFSTDGITVYMQGANVWDTNGLNIAYTLTSKRDAFLSSTGNATTIGAGTHPSSNTVLNIVSTSKGVLFPTLTSTNETAITTPDTGLFIFNSTLNAFRFYNGTAWTTIASGSSVPTVASVSDLNTGTDNTKFVSSLGLQGSKYLDQNGTKIFTTTAGTATAFTLILSPAITSYVAGQSFNVKFHVANTGTATLNVNGVGAINLVKDISTALVSGDIPINSIYNLFYDGTNFLIKDIGFAGISTSAKLAGALSDETGTGLVVFNTTPTFATSVLAGASFDAFNTITTTLNLGGAATTLNLGGTPTTALTGNLFSNITASGVTKTINLATGGASGSTTALNIGSATSGATNNIKLNVVPGNDTTGDIYYRNSSGFLSRLAIGSAGQFLSISGGIPSWGLAWSPNGNAGLTAGTNFLGTTDNTDIVLKRNNIIAGILNGALLNSSYGVDSFSLSASGGYNSAFGSSVLHSLTSGSENTGMGFNALFYLTSGTGNTAVGKNALQATTIGASNVGIGVNSFQANNGYSNVGIGGLTGQSLTTANFNILIGTAAGSNQTAGDKNTMIAYNGDFASSTGSNQLNIANVIWGTGCSGTGTTAAGQIGINTNSITSGYTLDVNGNISFGGVLNNRTTSDIIFKINGIRSGWIDTTTSNTAFGYNIMPIATGFDNTAFGITALTNLTNGNNNTGIGASSLYSNTTGGDNSAFGAFSLYSNTTGTGNTANGKGSLGGNTTATGNTAIGSDCLYGSNSYYNTGIGSQALKQLTSGGGNTAIGYQAAYNLTTGVNNTAIGILTDLPSNTANYQLSIMNCIFGIGMSGTVASPAGQVGINTIAPTSGYALDVNGSIRANSNMLINGLAGTGTRLATVTSTGLVNTLSAGTVSTILMTTSGAPVWSTIDNSSTPSGSLGAGAGITSTAYTLTGTTRGGTLSVTTGTGGIPSPSTAIITVTFASSFAFPTGCSVILYPSNSNAATLSGATSVYAIGNTTGWVLNSNTSPLAGSTTYTWNYIVEGF